MRLLHVVPSYVPAVRYGGPVVAVHGLCRALAAAGHEVHVFTTSVDGAGDLAVEPGGATALDGVNVRYFPVRAPRRWYRSPALAASLRRLAPGFDLVHVHALFLHPVSAAAGAARRAGVPYVVSPRGMLVRDLFARRSPWLKQGWLALLGRGVLEQAAAVHVTSPREAADVARFGLRLARVEAIPNGVDEAPPGRARRDPDSILFLGRLSWKKGIDRLLEATARLPHARLVVAGNDEEDLLPALRAHAQRLGIAARVRFTGPVAGEDKRALYERAGVFALASLSENFANTALEAMSAGCPVVLTPQVGLADAVREAGCGVVCGPSPEELAAAIDGVLTDRAGAERMGERGRALVRARYLWPRVAADMAALCADLCRQGAAAA